MKTDQNQAQEILVPLGKALKEAREAASLSIDAVAEKLNLSASTLRDLEDDLDNILATGKYPVIYLRGYLNNYAKLVHLTTLELFVEYQQLDSVSKQKKVLCSPSLIIPRTKKRSKILPLLFIVIVVSVLVYLFQKPLLSAFEAVNPIPTADVEIMPEAAHTLVLPITVEDEQDNVTYQDAEVVIEDSPIAETQLENEMTEQAAEIAIEDIPVIETKLENDVITHPALEEKIESAVQGQSEGDSAALIESVDEVVAIEVVEQPSIKDNVEIESIKLTFDAECWTEVFDATGKRIAFGLYQKGRVLALSGVAPFKLKLGDPSVVEIQYQDSIVTGEFTPGRSAQFNVPLS